MSRRQLDISTELLSEILADRGVIFQKEYIVGAAWDPFTCTIKFLADDHFLKTEPEGQAPISFARENYLPKRGTA